MVLLLLKGFAPVLKKLSLVKLYTPSFLSVKRISLKVHSLRSMGKFSKICLSGGGVRGIIELGILHYFWEKGDYDPELVNTYAATSIGTVISLLLICGYQPMDIFKEVYTSSRFFNLSRTSFWDIINKTGLIPIDNFAERIQKLVESSLGEIPTLKELQEKTGKTLITVAVNLTDMKVEYFSPESHPDLNSLEAVKMSCGLPLIFHKMFYKGKLYVDGGLGDGFPIQYIDDGRSSILGVVVSNQDPGLKETEFMGYLYRLIMMPIKVITELCQKGIGENITLIKVNSVETSKDLPGFLQFSLPSEKKMNMFLEGYEEARFQDNLEHLKVRF